LLQCVAGAFVVLEQRPPTERFVGRGERELHATAAELAVGLLNVGAVEEHVRVRQSVGDRAPRLIRAARAEPSVFTWPNLIIGHEAPDEFSLIYAARGVGRVWEGLPSTASPMGDLDTLIGRTRAAILFRLDVPMTTTQLARDLHQSPSTVSEHLTVLRGNGLLISWRAGRGVLYRRTPLASSLVAASEAQGQAGQTSARTQLVRMRRASTVRSAE
jgi:DNA-binding transcriptional ArsR family regulator